jgi:hypothetical protein
LIFNVFHFFISKKQPNFYRFIFIHSLVGIFLPFVLVFLQKTLPPVRVWSFMSFWIVFVFLYFFRNILNKPLQKISFAVFVVFIVVNNVYNFWVDINLEKNPTQKVVEILKNTPPNTCICTNDDTYFTYLLHYKIILKKEQKIIFLASEQQKSIECNYFLNK